LKIGKTWVGPCLKLLAKEIQHIILSFMFMLAVAAILTRNKRHCSWFQNSTCWSYSCDRAI